MPIASDADAVISDPETDVIYIGVSPRAHSLYARKAIEAKKLAFCEKPLGIDLEDSVSLMNFANEHKALQAIHLSLASARGVKLIREAIADDQFGQIHGADIRLHFSQWPRGWQENAKWLAEREEGGFVREVGTHFVYLAENPLGKCRLVSSIVRYPCDRFSAESDALAELDCAGIPVTLTGSVGGAGPDLIEFTLWGESSSYRLTDFYRLWSSTGGDWEAEFPNIENLALDAYMLQLDELVAMVDGRPHVLPDFQAALDVQKHIEAILHQA